MLFSRRTTLPEGKQLDVRHAVVSTSRLHFTARTSIILFIAACMLGVSLISYFFLMHNSIRLDESQSIWQSSHSLLGIFHVVGLDVHIPLYHFILHFWMFYFGQGIVTVRLLSLVFFLATIPVMYLLSSQLVTRRWALVATAVFAFSPFLDWYANEARMYTLLLLLSTLNQLFFLRIMRTGKGWAWFGLTAVIGAYSHYFFLFNLVAQGLFLLFNRRSFQPGSLKRLALVATAVATALTPWLLFVRSLGSASGSRPLLPVPSTVDFFNAYSQFVFGFQSNFINTIILSAWPIIVLLALVAIRRSQGVTPQFKYFATMALLPVLLAYGVSLAVKPFFLSRYMVIAVAPLLILVIYLLTRYKRWLAVSVICGLCIATAAASYSEITSAQNPVKEDYRAAAQDINAAVKPQDVVVLSAPFTVYPFEYYYDGQAQIRTLPMWNRSQAGQIPAFNKANLPKDVATLNKDHRYVYLLLSQDQGYEGTIYQYYLSHFKQVSHKTYSDDLSLYVYQVGYYTVPAIGTGNTAEPLP